MLTTLLLANVFGYTLPLRDIEGGELTGPLTSSVYCATPANRYVKVMTLPAIEPGTAVVVSLAGLLQRGEYRCYARAFKLSGKESSPSKAITVEVTGLRSLRRKQRARQ